MCIRDRTYGKTLDIWDRNNSPVRSVSHFEDDVLVPSCTCDTTGVFGSYFTPVNSRYFNAGRANVVNMPVYKYSLDEDGNATITGYSGSVSALAIPQTIDGHKVVAIGKGAFKGTCLVNVTIPDTVTEIGYSAFEDCKQLSSVSLSSNLTELGSGAFLNCSSLTSIRIPKSLESAYSGITVDGPFDGCTALKNVELESGMTKIPTDLFNGCPGFTTITIPDTVTEIGEAAFAYTNLTSIVIPDTVTDIENNAFSNCKQLSSVQLSNSLVSLGHDVFLSCTSLTSIRIPKSLESVSIFYGGPFEDCSALQNVELEPGMTRIPDDLFKNCTGPISIVIPDTVTEIGASAFYGSHLSSIVIPDTVTAVSYTHLTLPTILRV